jgi:hypothetical protein
MLGDTTAGDIVDRLLKGRKFDIDLRAFRNEIGMMQGSRSPF